MNLIPYFINYLYNLTIEAIWFSREINNSLISQMLEFNLASSCSHKFQNLWQI
jgi:hypothetical protein